MSETFGHPAGLRMLMGSNSALSRRAESGERSRLRFEDGNAGAKVRRGSEQGGVATTGGPDGCRIADAPPSVTPGSTASQTRPTDQS